MFIVIFVDYILLDLLSVVSYFDIYCLIHFRPKIAEVNYNIGRISLHTIQSKTMYR